MDRNQAVLRILAAHPNGIRKRDLALNLSFTSVMDEIDGRCVPRWWGRIGAESGLMVFGVFVSCFHLNAAGVLHWQGLDWSGLLVKYFTPAWAVTAATAGYLVGFLLAAVLRVLAGVANILGGIAIGI